MTHKLISAEELINIGIITGLRKSIVLIQEFFGAFARTNDNEILRVDLIEFINSHIRTKKWEDMI